MCMIFVIALSYFFRSDFKAPSFHQLGLVIVVALIIFLISDLLSMSIIGIRC